MSVSKLQLVGSLAKILYPKTRLRHNQIFWISAILNGLLVYFIFFHRPTNKVPPGLVFVSLLPVAWPRHQHSVMFQASQPTGLEEVGSGITQVRRDGRLTEALHLFGLHQFTERLERQDRVTVTKVRRTSGYLYVPADILTLESQKINDCQCVGR